MSDWPTDPPSTPPPPPEGPPGPGWWLASDGRYYPPEQAPGAGWPQGGAPVPPTYQYGGFPAPTQTNGLAIASMVLGILWIYWVGSILALIFGYIAKKQIDESGGRQSGRGMAIAGIVLGWIGVAALALVIVFAVFLANSDDLNDEINSDPSDGVCNEERFVQDPDC